MIKLFILSLLFSLGCQRPNRACILAENALEQSHKDGKCESISLGETKDTAVLYFDGGKRFCQDMLLHGPKDGPLFCDILKPTTDEVAAAAKAGAEAEAKAKLEADAKLKVEAEAKARAEAAGSGSGKAKP